MPKRSFRESIGNALFGIEGVRKESYSKGYRAALDEETGYIPLRVFDEAYRESYRTRDQDKGWTPISKISGDKDLLPTEYDELHKAVYKLYTTNPMAKGLVDLTTNFIVGENLNVVAEEEDVQEIADEFWNDDHNNMMFRSERLLSETILFGEQFVVIFPNFDAGNTQIFQVDPIKVDSIATDKDNAEKEILVILKMKVGQSKPKAYVAWDAIPRTAGSNSKVEKLAEGMAIDKLKEFLPETFNVGDTEKKLDDYEIAEDAFCFHYKINAVTGSARGWSDLATNVNWIAIFDEGLLNTMRLRRFRTAFIYDVTLKGAKKDAIEKKKKEITASPPRPGSVMVHNDEETWETKQPNIDSSNNAEDLHQVLMHAGRASNIPEHYMGSGGDVNRASASEMGLPTIKYMKRRQKFFKAMIEQLIKVAIEVNIYATKGKLKADANMKFAISFPDIDTKDNLAIAQAAQALIMSLVAAKDSGWISKKTAQRLMFKFLGEENTPEEEDEIIKTESGKSTEEDDLVTKDYKNVNVKEALV